MLAASPTNQLIMLLHTCHSFGRAKIGVLEFSSPSGKRVRIVTAVLHLVGRPEMRITVLLYNSFTDLPHTLHIVSTYLWAFIPTESTFSFLFNFNCL